MKTVIIGGVAGGASAAARLRRLDEKARNRFAGAGRIRLVCQLRASVLYRRRHPGPGRPDTADARRFHARFRIDVRTLHEAVSIDPQRKTVAVRDIRRDCVYEESYDNLVLSPGAEPIRPKIDGIDSPAVFSLRNIPRYAENQGVYRIRKPVSAVVVGGGYIGVEMAENLKKAGLDVSIVELSDHLIAPLDFDMAADVHRYLREKGVRLYLNNGVKAIDGGARCLLQDGKLYADMVILSVGVRPETELAVRCGIRAATAAAPSS